MARRRLFEIIGLVFWGIKARMQEVVENASRNAASPSEKVGQNTIQMRAWRALGTALIDIPVLVFNIARADFRDKHLAAFAQEVQTSMSGVQWERAFQESVAMLDSVRCLMEMVAVVRLVQQLASAHRWVHIEKIPRTTLWVALKTFLAHRCWRHWPLMYRYLPVRLTVQQGRQVKEKWWRLENQGR